MFLKLTEMGSGTPQFINMDRVERMVAKANGGSLLFYAAEQCEAHVKESPDQIAGMLAGQLAGESGDRSPAAYLRAFTEAVNGIRGDVGAACRAIAQGR